MGNNGSHEDAAAIEAAAKLCEFLVFDLWFHDKFKCAVTPRQIAALRVAWDAFGLTRMRATEFHRVVS